MVVAAENGVVGLTSLMKRDKQQGCSKRGRGDRLVKPKHEVPCETYLRAQADTLVRG